MFTHATECVFILSSLESASTFGRTYLDEFICPELTELMHNVFCITLMQIYLNDYSMIKTSWSNFTYVAALVYQLLRSLVTLNMFIMHQTFYLSSAVAHLCVNGELAHKGKIINTQSLFSYTLLCFTLNIGHVSDCVLSAIDDLIVRGKILIGHTDFENPLLTGFSRSKITSIGENSGNSSRTINATENSTHLKTLSGAFLSPRPISIPEMTKINHEGENNRPVDMLMPALKPSTDPTQITMPESDTESDTTNSVSEPVSFVTATQAETATNNHRNCGQSDMNVHAEELEFSADALTSQSRAIFTLEENTNREANKIDEATQTRKLREFPARVVACLSHVSDNPYTDERCPEEWKDPLPNGQGNPVFHSAMNVFYKELISDFGQVSGISMEAPKENISYCLIACKDLLTGVVQFAEQLSTSRGARVESISKRRTEAVCKHPMKYLSYYCYNVGFRAISSYQNGNHLESKNLMAERFQDVIYERKTDANGNGLPSSIDTMCEAYKFVTSEVQPTYDFMSEKFLEEVQDTLNSYNSNIEIETCIRYLEEMINKIDRNMPIAFTPLLHFARLYKPLKTVYEGYQQSLETRQYQEKIYCDFILWADSTNDKKEYEFCKDMMNRFTTWDEISFNRDLLAVYNRLYPRKIQPKRRFRSFWRIKRDKNQ